MRKQYSDLFPVEQSKKDKKKGKKGKKDNNKKKEPSYKVSHISHTDTR